MYWPRVVAVRKMSAWLGNKRRPFQVAGQSFVLGIRQALRDNMGAWGWRQGPSPTEVLPSFPFDSISEHYATICHHRPTRNLSHPYLLLCIQSPGPLALTVCWALQDCPLPLSPVPRRPITWSASTCLLHSS